MIVDIGSNIGISALYFLSSSRSSHCYLYEPNPTNLRRLKENLSNYVHRVAIYPVAVSDHSGIVEFHTEPSGRYGGVNQPFSSTISVSCIHINELLEEILSKHPVIDILKIDTEGEEMKILQAISPNFQKRIMRIYIEGHPPDHCLPAGFHAIRRGSISYLTNTNPN